MSLQELFIVFNAACTLASLLIVWYVKSQVADVKVMLFEKFVTKDDIHLYFKERNRA